MEQFFAGFVGVLWVRIMGSRNFMGLFYVSNISAPCFLFFKLYSNGITCPAGEKLFNLSGLTLTSFLTRMPIPNYPDLALEPDRDMKGHLCSFAGCTMEYRVEAGFGSELKNGTWTGVIGFVAQRCQSALCLAVLSPNINRKHVLDYTYGPLYDNFNLLISKAPS